MNDTEYERLLKKYNNLHKMYTDLQHEYSENVIVQSMNDMKRRYDELMENTVPTYKYNLAVEQKKHMLESIIGSCVIIDHVKRELKKVETETLLDRTNRLFKVQLELIMLKDILKDSTGTN